MKKTGEQRVINLQESVWKDFPDQQPDDSYFHALMDTDIQYSKLYEVFRVPKDYEKIKKLLRSYARSLTQLFHALACRSTFPTLQQSDALHFVQQ